MRVDFQAMIDATNNKNSFMLHNGIRLTVMEKDYAVVEAHLKRENRNLYGAVHGGMFLTMADCAAGAACRTDGRKYVTLHGSLDFIRSAETGRVTARAQVKHRGRTTCLVSVEITGEDHTVYASGHYTFFCRGQLPAPG